MSNRILLVEDDVALGQQVVETLSRAGFEPHWLQDGDAARAINPDDYRMIILDLILSARDDTADKIRGLKLGADDYVTEPFFPEELIARVQACLRRPTLVGTERLIVGPIQVDLERRARGRPGLSRHPFPRHRVFAYDADLRSRNPDSPAFPPDLAQQLRAGNDIATYRSEDHRRTQVAVRMPWNEGPCAVVLIRTKGPPPWFSGAVLMPAFLVALVMIVVALVSADPRRWQR